MMVEGIAVEVHDNDGDFGYIKVYEEDTTHVMSECGSSGDECDSTATFSFWLYPTRRPSDDVVVVVKSPTSKDKENAAGYFKFKAEDKPNVVVVANPENKLQLCYGNCETDDDCAPGLGCYQRSNYNTFVPACLLGAYDDDDNNYCVPSIKLNWLGWTPRQNLNLCEGDCDRNSDCAPGLVCFERNDHRPIPGCIGLGVSRGDYCIYDPNIPPTLATFESTTTVKFDTNDWRPKVVVVSYNEEAARLDNTDFGLLITMDVSDANTKDENFVNTEQSIQPVDVKLLPSKISEVAKSLTVVPPSDGLSVVEGEAGGSYDIYLRPCTDAMKSDTRVSIVPSVENQVCLRTSINGDCLDTAEISGISAWNNECHKRVTVFATSDGLQEGDHYVTLGHNVTDLTGNEIPLNDLSPMLASNVLVRIYDQDTAGVIIQGIGGVTATAEKSLTYPYTTGDNRHFFEDTYMVRLASPPEHDVTVTLWSKEVATDRNVGSTPNDGRDFSERHQVHVGPNNPTEFDSQKATEFEITFTPENWNQSVEVRVAAIDDDQVEGVDYFNFPSQPSNLALIQGPVALFGGYLPSIPQLGTPRLFPGENNVSFIICWSWHLSVVCRFLELTSPFLSSDCDIFEAAWLCV